MSLKQKKTNVGGNPEQLQTALVASITLPFNTAVSRPCGLVAPLSVKPGCRLRKSLRLLCSFPFLFLQSGRWLGVCLQKLRSSPLRCAVCSERQERVSPWSAACLHCSIFSFTLSTLACSYSALETQLTIISSRKLSLAPQLRWAKGLSLRGAPINPSC